MSGEEVIADARMFHSIEQSRLVLTLCVEETRGHTRLYHRDFHLTLERALLLKKSIDALELEQRQDMV